MLRIPWVDSLDWPRCVGLTVAREQAHRLLGEIVFNERLLKQ